jgi:ribosomal protein RSM22 (predicted rRNA methylase)
LRLPEQLAAAIETEAARFERKQLVRAVEELSARYRENQGPSTPPRRGSARDDKGVGMVADDRHSTAYLITRMPASFAAISAVLRELSARWPNAEIRSLLDLGAGPGTALWAVSEHFPALESATLLERDAGFIALGKKLAAVGESPVMTSAAWRQADLAGEWDTAPHDLVVISYALNELRENAAANILKRAWERTSKALLIIEPGTPNGFASILRARETLMAQRAHLAAPCPHEDACPIASKPGDWCHFAARLERSALHRRLKSGDLGYEDEKFSYLIFTREPLARAAARILRHPYQGKGHIQLELCGADGLRQQTVSRKHGPEFKAAKKARWGDRWP